MQQFVGLVAYIYKTVCKAESLCTGFGRWGGLESAWAGLLGRVVVAPHIRHVVYI